MLDKIVRVHEFNCLLQFIIVTKIGSHNDKWKGNYKK